MTLVVQLQSWSQGFRFARADILIRAALGKRVRELIQTHDLTVNFFPFGVPLRAVYPVGIWVYGRLQPQALRRIEM